MLRVLEHGMARIVPSVEAASNIRMVDERDKLVVRPAFEVPITFSKIYINLDGMLDGWHCKGCVS